MGVYKIFPSQDTTIYTDYTTLNAGLDEILDLSKNAPNLYASSSTNRILIKYDNDDIADVIEKSGTNFTASLKLYNANVEGIPTNFKIIANPIYESWDMGTGRFNNIPETNAAGASTNWTSINSKGTIHCSLTGFRITDALYRIRETCIRPSTFAATENV